MTVPTETETETEVAIDVHQSVGLPLEAEAESETDTDVEEPAELETPASAAPSTEKQAREASDMLKVGIPAPTNGGAPDWVDLPSGFKFPRGKQVIFLKFRSSWTDAPWLGKPLVDEKTGETHKDPNGLEILFRQCVIWPINVGDKKLALNRAMRDPNRASDELTKQMIRVHDGIKCDWGTVHADGIEMFWNQLGEKCRSLLFRLFSQLHVLDSEGTRDFLTNCIEVRTTGS